MDLSEERVFVLRLELHELHELHELITSPWTDKNDPCVEKRSEWCDFMVDWV